MTGMMVVILIGWFLLALQSSLGPSIIIGIALAGLLVVLPAIIFWLAYRR